MRQSLLLSGLIFGVLVALAGSGVLGATVVATHELAQAVVIANGVRAGRRRPTCDARRRRRSGG